MKDKMVFDSQFSAAGIQIIPKQSESIYVVIAKPTRSCNADCSYCSSPPVTEEDQEGNKWEPEWNLEKFKQYFDKVYPYLANGAMWIWHGGEPMLMGAKFYKDSYEYAQEKIKKEGRQVFFSMQTNLLSYSDKWYPIFSEIFGGSISTSFDPDETHRSIKKSTKTFSKVFKRALEKTLDDGFRPMVIGVYTEETAHMMEKMYDWSYSLGDKSFPLRFNYCHPTGRLETNGEAIKPETYGKALINIYNRWIKDVPNFTITPLDQMFKKVIGIDGEGHCPWTRSCGGRFIEIEPEGDVYNCADFADLGKKYCFGNLNDNTSIADMLNTKPALQIRRRVTLVPDSCQKCEHFNDCEGGCMRDSTLYEHGLYGKFHYCQSWKMVFARIKESILSGEADGIIKKYNCIPEEIKRKIKMEIRNHFSYTNEEINNFIINGLPSIYGYGSEYEHGYELIKKNDPEYINDSIQNANKQLKSISVKVITAEID